MKNLSRVAVTLFGLVALGSAAEVRMQVVYDAVLQNGFTIRHHHMQKVQGITRLYLSADPNGSYVDIPSEEIVSIDRLEIPLLPRAPVPQTATREDMDRWVASASDQHQVDADLIRSVIKAESGFDPRAVSSKGAQGLMQLMPGTAIQLGVTDAFAPDKNIEGGTRYLRDLLVLYNNDMAKALAAYNAGPQRVAQYNGVPPYRETHAYVARVIKDFNRTKLAQHATAKPGAKSASTKLQKPKQAAETKPKDDKPTAVLAN